jgi:alpha-beta hydrolase superfamily lysophospholipase
MVNSIIVTAHCKSTILRRLWYRKRKDNHPKNTSIHFDRMTFSPTTRENTSPPFWLSVALGGLVAVSLTAGVVLSTARSRIGPKKPSARPKPPRDIDQLENWINTQEAKFTDIKPGNAKGIGWANAHHGRTPWAVVYLHGFSASRLETDPVSAQVALALGANVFHARLAGHGRTTEALCTASAQDWMADALEALQIGQVLGEKVLVISCSTGSTLATWLALSSKGRNIAAHVFMSPNFGLRDKRAELIYSLWSKPLALALRTQKVGWVPAFPEEANAWTTPYPMRALLPMMALLRHVRRSDLSQFKTPVLVLFSEDDQTVNPEKTHQVFAKFASPFKVIQKVSYSNAKGQHVLAGALRDPHAVSPIVSSIVNWVKALPATKKRAKRGQVPTPSRPNEG